MSGLYIHIPFCESRCVYCGFYSTTLDALKDDYVGAVCKELLMRRDEAAAPLTTIYFGGGTPSTLTYGQLQRLFYIINKVYIAPHPTSELEITMECNPDDVCRDDFRLPKEVNRVSMGAQTFNDERLRFLRRRHSAAQVSEAVDKLRSLGIENISVDLMFGFPLQTLDELNSDLDRMLSLNVEHVSAYSLMYEEGTPLYRLLESGKISETDEELSLSMYKTIVRRLKEAGYEHYEISNFARPGQRSRHNSAYWHRVPYIGVGAAAHSFNGSDTRSWNVSDVRRYIKEIGLGHRPAEFEHLDSNTQYDDLITTAMRTSEGVDTGSLMPQHRDYLLKMAEPYIRRGLLHLDNAHLHLTEEGVFVSDMIMADLMWA